MMGREVLSWNPDQYQFIISTDHPPYKKNISATIGDDGNYYIKHLVGSRQEYHPNKYKYIGVLLASTPHLSRQDLVREKIVRQIREIPSDLSSLVFVRSLFDFSVTTVILPTNDVTDQNSLEGKSTAARLGDLLAHSGAVILLQHSSFEYHFTERLKLWVHYVPVTFSTSDIIEKIEWLQHHDEMVKQIAINAHNFGKSFLRLEDMYCYTATALHTLGLYMNGTDVLKPFHP
eukprot:gene17693-24641_t